MRITNGMLINNTLNSLNANLKRMTKVQDQLSTGKKISLPSDDPIIASKSLKYRSDSSEIDQFLTNAQDGISWTDVTDSAFSNMDEIIQRAKEIAVQASSDTLSANDRVAIQQEASQLYNQLINLGNTTYAGRYIFSGFKTDKPLILDKNKNFNYANVPVVNNGTATTAGTTFRLQHDNIDPSIIGGTINAQVGNPATPPLAPGAFTVVAGVPAAGEVQVDLTTGKLTFNAADLAAGINNPTATYSLTRLAGDYNPDVYTYSNTSQTAPMEGEDIKYEVGVKDKVTINIIGDQIFGATTPTSNSGALLKQFSDFVNDLASNNSTGIQNAISNMEGFLDKVLEQRSTVGATSNRLDLTKNRLTSEQTNTQELMSLNEDADIAQVIMNLKNNQNVYQASLSVGAQIIQPTLIDYIK